MTRSGTERIPVRRSLWPVALIGLGAIMAACTASQPPPAPTYPVVANYPLPPRPARPHNRSTAPQSRDSARAPPEAALANTAPGEPVDLLAAAPPTPPEIPLAGLGDTQEAPPAPSPTDLTRVDQYRATKLLGPAMATESRGPAIVWHYKSSRCELDLVFYMEMRSGDMRSLHQDFKGADNPQQRQACLRAIVQENSRSAATASKRDSLAVPFSYRNSCPRVAATKPAMSNQDAAATSNSILGLIAATPDSASLSI